MEGGNVSTRARDRRRLRGLKIGLRRYHSRRAEYGATGYRLFQSTDNPKGIVVLIEFDVEEDARAWTEYRAGESDYRAGESDLGEPEMAKVEPSSLPMVEEKQLSAA